MAELSKSRAIVLNTLRWKETSKIVSLFSREMGIIKVIAKGAFRPKSPFAGKLESLNLLEIIIATRSTRSLQILTDADLLNSFKPLRQDIERFPYALAVLELINETIDEQHADPLFFDFTLHMLKTLETARQPVIIFIYFLLKLISFLGFKPDFRQCTVCGTKQLENLTYFSIEKGSLYCQDCAGGSLLIRKLRGDEIGQLNHLQNCPYRRVAEFDFSQLAGNQIINFLLEYLNFHLEKSISIRALGLLVS